MWKSIVLCISLFGGAALGLALGARFVQPAALPAAAAIGLCLIGLILILAAPTAAEVRLAEGDEARTIATATATERVELREVAPAVHASTLPFEALNS